MTEETSDLPRGIHGLSNEKQLAFVLIVCERMMAGLEKFGRETGFDVSLYRESLDIGWIYLEHGTRISNVESLSQRCFDDAPDTSDFGHPLVSAALDAALAIGLMLRFMSDFKINRVVEIIGLARDTLALYIQAVILASTNDIELDDILMHPVMRRETDGQLEDIAILSELPAPMQESDIRQIRIGSREGTRLIPFYE